MHCIFIAARSIWNIEYSINSSRQFSQALPNPGRLAYRSIKPVGKSHIFNLSTVPAICKQLCSPPPTQCLVSCVWLSCLLSLMLTPFCTRCPLIIFPCMRMEGCADPRTEPYLQIKITADGRFFKTLLEIVLIELQSIHIWQAKSRRHLSFDLYFFSFDFYCRVLGLNLSLLLVLFLPLYPWFTVVSY